MIKFIFTVEVAIY